ncbi:MAG: hypothetical protein ACTHJW_07170 [Streptosporangiaceae bacterium]
MHDNVIVSHRGARFEIGRGPGYYAIWRAGAAQWRPIEWWPENPEGWRAAWARFTDVEPRRGIHPVNEPAEAAEGQVVAAEAHASPTEPFTVSQPPDGQSQPLGPGQSASLGQPSSALPLAADRTAGLSATLRRAGRPAIIAAALLAAGVAVGVAGLFPGYFSSTGLAGHADQLIPHLIYLATWAVSAALIIRGGTRQRTGALLAAGISLITFGFFFADLGTGISSADVGAGLVLSSIGWAACMAGSVLAVRLGAAGAPARPRSLETTLTLLLAAAGALGTAIAFAPSWDSFTLRTAAGTSQTITAGNAFANPALVIAGDVVVMVTVVVVVVAAASWKPIRLGAALLAGAIVPMAAQAISAVVQIAQVTPSSQFGIPPAQAGRLGLTISSGLTPAFWIYTAFVAALILTAALLVSAPAPPPPPPTPNPARPGQPGVMSPAAPAVG